MLLGLLALAIGRRALTRSRRAGHPAGLPEPAREPGSAP
ncbi:hypothetical protein ABZY20_21355 [Streptomyces sp. NPDC006624]